MNDRNLKASVLSLSLLTVLAGSAVAPALGSISEAFSDASFTLIRLITSLPALAIVGTSLLNTKILKRYTVKTVLVTGLILYLIGGLGGAFATNIYMLLVFRFILGVGTGLIVPLSLGLIPYLFQPEDQVKLIGYASASNNLGGMVATICSGLLIGLSWRASFFVYLVAVIPLFLTIKYVPDFKLERPNGKLTWNQIKLIAPYALSIFVVMLIFYVLPTNFSLFVTTEQLFSPSLIGIVMSMNTLGAFMIGMNMARLKHRFNSRLKYMGTLALIIGFLMISVCSSIFMLIIALLLTGVGTGILNPLLNNQITRRVNKEEATAAISISTVMLYGGQFLSPLVVQIVNPDASIRGPFIIATFLGVILLVALTKIVVD